MTSSDVPTASGIVNPSASTRAGTMTKPTADSEESR